MRDEPLRSGERLWRLSHGEDVTVVVPTISGRETLLDRALLSVGRQTTAPREVLVIEDEERRGAWWVRNRGLDLADTTWVAWLDDDDELLPRHVECLLAAVRRTEADLAYPCMEVTGGRNPLAVDDGTGRWVLPCGVAFGPAQERHLRRAGNFIPVTYLARADVVRLVGGMPRPYSVEWPRDCEDYGLLIRLLDAGARFTHVPEVTWRYHIHAANTGGGVAGSGGSARERFA